MKCVWSAALLTHFTNDFNQMKPKPGKHKGSPLSVQKGVKEVGTIWSAKEAQMKPILSVMLLLRCLSTWDATSMLPNALHRHRSLQIFWGTLSSKYFVYLTGKSSVNCARWRIGHCLSIWHCLVRHLFAIRPHIKNNVFPVSMRIPFLGSAGRKNILF